MTVVRKKHNTNNLHRQLLVILLKVPFPSQSTSLYSTLSGNEYPLRQVYVIISFHMALVLSTVAFPTCGGFLHSTAV